jgi:N-methylhydantoinase A
VTWHLGIDIGGTFTDAVAFSSTLGETRTAKVWSVRNNPVDAIGSAISALGLVPRDVGVLTFGTTVVTNAMIEGRIARVALLTTAGFRDVLHIGRMNRRVIYSIAAPHRDPAPVPREDRHEIDERLNADGSVRVALDEPAARATIAKLDPGFRAVAVCLLHAYANPAHEQALGALCRSHFDHVALSHEIWPQAKEFERTLATVLNAGVMPIVADYLDELGEYLPDGTRLELFHSAGGMIAPEAARATPLALALSGPAAGVAAACRVAEDVGAPQAISLDMGGTTTDVCLIVDGRPEIRDEAQLGGFTVSPPMLAVQAIGGSIVRLGPSGLQVGPDSAGADPGPACYRRGGTEPTITDAAVLLGFLRPIVDSDAPMKIDPAAAAVAYGPLCRTLSLAPSAAAAGVIRVANAAMARALRRITIDRGVDLRRSTLIAFGGAGPMFAAMLADDVGIAEVVVPRNSSALSAVGCLLTAPSYTRQRTVRLGEADWTPAGFAEICRDVAGEAVSSLRLGRSGTDGLELDYVAFMRYAGQSYAIEVPCTPETDVDELRRRFWENHEALDGYHTREPWEIRSLRVRATLPAEPIVFRPPAASADARDGDESTCWFDGAETATPFLDREALGTGRTASGPAVVVDSVSTTVVPPGWRATVTPEGHIRMTREGR